MSLSELQNALEILQPFVYGGVAVAAYLQWRRRPGRASAWLAASFGVLGLVVVAGEFVPEGSTGPMADWAQKLTIAILVLFPYCLYRFMTSLIKPTPWVKVTATIMTGAVALSALVLPPFPEGDARPTWLKIYLAALLTQWVFLSGVVAVRLWRAGRGQRTVVRRRMRLMSVGAMGLALALVVAGEAPAGDMRLDALVQLLALSSAPLMLIGFATPHFLRTAWRRREETALKDARLSLMEATTESEVARTLLRHARTVVGASAAVQEGAEGEIIGSQGLDEERVRAITSRRDDPASDESSNGSMMTIPMSSGRLTVIADPFTPFFNHDEVTELEGLASLADLALARIRVLEGRQRLAEIVESSDDAIIAQSLDGTIRSWNRGAERIYGYRSEEAVGKPISMIVPSDIDNDGTKILEKVSRGESIEHYETRRQTKDGRTIDVSLTVSPIRGADGRISGASAIARDVTELKRVSEAARVSEERNRTVISTANDAYIEIDSKSVVREWNAAAEEMFGTSRKDALGRELPELIIPAQYRAAHRKGVAEYLKTGEGPVLNTTLELTALRNQTEEFPVELTIWPIGLGSTVTFHAFVRDITERISAEEAITAAKDEADRANRAKSDFLSRMSHELRTPLNAILGFAQLLEMDQLTPDQADGTAEIIKAGRHLVELINEVLDISRIEAGKLRLSLESVDVVQAVEDSISLLKPQARREGVSMTLDRPHAPEPFPHVTADRQRLKQVLLNLISNGIKYNREDGSVRVSLEVAKQGRLVRIHVADAGNGIPAERMEQLFAPFERLGAEESGIEGTGLGLALSKSLVKAMGGTISVASEVGTGTTFSVELATAPDVTVPEDERPALKEVATRSTSRTILYIEDNLSNLKLVERLVGRRPGISLISAMQGGIGVTMARDHRPDLIFLDLNLPDIPGEEVLARLRSDPQTAELPVVVISADATSGQAKRLLAGGARAYLTKPLDVNRLFELIDTFCV